MTVATIMHWLGADTAEEKQASEKGKKRLEDASKKHAEACERHVQVNAETTKTAKELRELTVEATQCFAAHVASSSKQKAVAEPCGENLP